jgi:hypothetical protein
MLIKIMDKLFLFFLMSFFLHPVFSQDKYWIIFKDKDISGYNLEKNLSKETIKNRIRYDLPLEQYTDVPLTQRYIDTLSKKEVKVICKSKWLNSVSAFLSDDQVNEISSLSFVKSVELIDRRIILTGSCLDVEPDFYTVALKQMQAELFAEKGLTGKGVSVGLIDAGFYRASSDSNLSHIFKENKLIQQRDFLPYSIKDLVNDTTAVSDYHGRIVLSHVSGYNAAEKTQMGLALNSNFYLARSEDEVKEHRGEEDNWVMAMEWMDSLGVRLINTSLGYSISMDDPKDNYKQEEMNGKTARISKAAQLAVDEKGIFLVVSAGNEGSNPRWRIISAPADAEGVLSIGATKDKNWEKIGYSSIGPDFLPYLKPNVSCFSQYGTSFSAPAITGFVACLMEKDSMLTNKELKIIVEKSGHLYPYGNNYIGYGVPQAGKALQLIANPKHEFGNCTEKRVKAAKVLFGSKVILRFNKQLNMDAVLFHKKNETIVLQQNTSSIKNGRLMVRKLSGAKRTTISMGLEVIEVIWE